MEKISIKEKIAYGLGDFASSMFWKLFSMFLMFFYTDVFGISAAAVGTMFLVTRIWDSLNDPMMGIIADRTHTKWGKFRPYLFFGAIPFGLIGFITFLSPDLSESGKLIYAYVTYTLMMMAYTAVNVPYSSLMGVMTNSSSEKTSLASFRFIGAFSGGLLVAATANGMVSYFGKEANGADNMGLGFQWTIGIYAILAAILFVVTFLGTKERLSVTSAPESNLKLDLKDMAKNAPWFIMLGASISILIFNSLRDGSIIYYFKYYVGDQTVFGTEFSYETLSSSYMSIWIGTNILGVLFAEPLAKKLGKKNAFQISVLTSAVLSIAIFFLDPNQVILLFLLNILIGISAGIVLPLIWSMYADIADYSEWKNGRRATGLIFSSSSMSQKFGWTLGGAITGWMLSGFGFEPNIVQTEQTLFGIKFIMSIAAGIGALLASVFLYFYSLDEKSMNQIESELAVMRTQHQQEHSHQD